MSFTDPELLVGEFKQPNNPIAKILMVDDNELARKYRPKILSKAGFHIETAINGYDAVEIIKNNLNKFDAILMNYKMPIYNGIKATSIIRTIGYRKPIIGFSCGLFNDKINYDNGIRAGMTDCIDAEDHIIINTLFSKLFDKEKIPNKSENLWKKFFSFFK